MTNCDMVIITIVGSEVFVNDYWSTGQTTPTLDSSQDYTLLGYEITATSMNVKFKRLLNTGDSSQDTVLSEGTYNWIAAFDPALDGLA